MKKISILFLALFLALAFTGCKYNFVVPEEIPPIDDGGGNGGGGGTTDISFAQSVETIFTSKNNCTACHKTGSTSPDLSTGKAYASITPLINKANPEASKIYTYPGPGASTHKHKQYTAAEAATLLNWIKQGAKNN